MHILPRKTQILTVFCMWVAGAGFFAITLDPADALFGSIIMLVASAMFLAAELL